jgi:ribosomal protein S18 acetylase RimI-like enzyme
MPLTVRAANPDDAAVLSQLGGKTFYDTFRPYNSEEDMQAYIAKAYNEPLLVENLRNPKIHYALAYENNMAVGYIKLLLNATHEKLSGKCIELEKIYVLDSALGGGAGKILMDYAIHFSTGHNYEILFLGVWEENKRAVRFYEKTGFTVFAHRSFKLGSRLCDDYIMKLDLHLQA